MSDDGAPGPSKVQFPISLARRAGDFVYTSAVGDHFFHLDDVRYDANGTVISDGSPLAGKSIEEQSRGAFHTLEAALKTEGCTLADVVLINAWLADPRDFAAFNAVYAELMGENKPVRSVFGIRFMFDCKVEIQAIAHKPLP